ncbi:MAG: NAD(+)/NADH kinase [Nitrospinae bacterium]|nr:NAD(+)/NADH kinase [Nitrospinota bacterium]
MPKLSISSIGTMVKQQSPLARKALLRVRDWGKKRGVRIIPDRASAKVLGGSAAGLDPRRFFDAIDSLVVLGGDGTFLAAARAATNHSTPLLGVNLGSLGFMTEVALDEMEPALDELLAGSFVMEERMMLDLEIGSGRNRRRGVALNEVVLSGRTLAKMIELSLSINGQQVTLYRADGLIFSTPTGSTAYAISCGGPILYPTMDAILICPISPHTLTNRPVVVPGDALIEISLVPGQKDVSATLDGHIRLEVGQRERITVRRSSMTTRIIKVPGRTHFDTLRNKLGWGGSSTPAKNNV